MAQLLHLFLKTKLTLMTQSFDAGRWWLLVAKHWAENLKKYSLALIAITGLLVFWYVLLLLTDNRHSMDTGTQIGTYYTGLFLAGCLYGSILFSDLGSKTKGLNYLAVPASHLEKLLCSLFYVVIVFFTVYTALFYTVDVLMVKISNAVEHSRWLKYHETWRLYEPQNVTNVFYEKGYSNKENVLYYLLLLFFVLQSAFVLGSVYFPKFSFIKTVISLLLIGLVIAFIIAKVLLPILPPGSFYKGIDSYHVYTMQELPKGGGVTIYSDDNTDKLVTLPSWISDVLMFLLKYAFAPLFWMAAYYRLKEKEI